MSEGTKAREKAEALRQHKQVLKKIAVLDGLEALCLKHNVLLDAVLSDARTKRIQEARIACYIHLADLEMSHSEIGKVMLRDRSTVTTALIDVKRRARNGGSAPNAPT